MSGVRPTLWIQRPFGVSHLAIVSFKPDPSLRSMNVCTTPLPKLVSPIRIARPRSCSAPARISLADALPLLINTTS